MARNDTEALGQVVRELRTSKRLTQEELGKRAGYATGAGVSISRLENGQLMPGVERLHGVAEALGLTWGELESRASKLKSAETTAKTSSNSLGTERLEHRIKRIQEEIAARTESVTALSQAFSSAEERASKDFFMRFLEVAARLEGAPQPAQTLRKDNAPHADVDEEPANPLEAASDVVGQLLAGGTGSAATLTLALLRGGAFAAGGVGGNKGLAGIIAAPAVLLLAAGGLVWMVKRNRQQQQELAAKLDLAEAELNATEQGFEALKDILPRATVILSYIAVHAAHALNRWETQIGPAPVIWDRLSSDEQMRYQDFIEIAAAQITIQTIDAQRFLASTEGHDLNQLIAQTDKALNQSHDVSARV
jgi:transcriptional regulator with XRE-family HTH domain